jgi:double zinc ribbon protein
MTFITSDQDKFLKFLGKGSNKIERDRALSIIAEMREDAGWVNFEDITTRSPQTLTGALDISLDEATKLHAAASALLPPQQQAPTTPASTPPQILTLEMPGTTRCGNCSNVLQPSAEFCSRCGTPVASKLVCVKCGMQGGVGETFCLKDGIPLVPAIDALCISELMSGENMSITEATRTLQEMDAVRRGKLQEKAMRRGGGLFGDICFLG